MICGVYKGLKIIPCLPDTVGALFRRILGYIKGRENLSCEAKTWWAANECIVYLVKKHFNFLDDWFGWMVWIVLFCLMVLFCLDG